MINGIQTSRIFGDAGKYRTFRQCELVNGFIKIIIGGRFHAESSLPQIDSIEIIGEDFFFGSIFFHLDGKVLLLDLSFDFCQEITLVPNLKHIVFDELLSNSAGPLSGAAIAQRSETRADDSL